jgi:hypothetical protein
MLYTKLVYSYLNKCPIWKTSKIINNWPIHSMMKLVLSCQQWRSMMLVLLAAGEVSLLLLSSKQIFLLCSAFQHRVLIKGNCIGGRLLWCHTSIMASGGCIISFLPWQWHKSYFSKERHWLPCNFWHIIQGKFGQVYLFFTCCLKESNQDLLSYLQLY